MGRRQRPAGGRPAPLPASGRHAHPDAPADQHADPYRRRADQHADAHADAHRHPAEQHPDAPTDQYPDPAADPDAGGPSATPVPSDTPTATSTPVPISIPGVTFTPCPIQFSDVDPTNPFYGSVRCLPCRGIVSGYPTSPPCGTAPCFQPGADVTRGQTAKFVANAANYQDVIPSTQQRSPMCRPAARFGSMSSSPICMA